MAEKGKKKKKRGDPQRPFSILRREGEEKARGIRGILGWLYGKQLRFSVKVTGYGVADRLTAQLYSADFQG